MNHCDLFVIGSGPAGQKAAIQAAKAGLNVVVCEQLKEVGGACVHQGTIPSKALRERALDQSKALARMRSMNITDCGTNLGVAALIGEMGAVIKAHDAYMAGQLARNDVEVVHGRARFVDANHIDVRHVDGSVESFSADHFVIASGSKPRLLEHIAVDHEFIYDSDSILSLAYLPQSMVVLGGGVIACEYASTFALLGVKVTLIDRFPNPLGFLDRELTERFVASFERYGGSFVGNSNVTAVNFDGISGVETHLREGTVVKSDKVLCTLGRVSQLDGLRAENAGVTVNENHLVDVDEAGQTSVPHIYAVGDVVGPPSLASASMEQGRRAACAILGLDPGGQSEWIPTGIYTVPEMACVGLTEAAAREAYGEVVIGYANFNEIARGHIANNSEGLLKLVVSGDRIVRGIHIVGAHATDIIHIGQMGLIQNASVDVYVENVFNFPTYSESYRVAALQAAAKLGELDS